MYRMTYAEINIDHLKENVAQIINYYHDYKYYIGVVKANAYGHGSYIVKHLIESGINYLAVSSLEEALKIRNEHQTIPILCLEPIGIEYLSLCLDNDITITVHDYDYFKELLNVNFSFQLKIHLKLDTGMNRLGIKDKKQVEEIINTLFNHSFLYLEGVYTHLATAGISDKMWDNQVASFKDMLSNVDLTKIPIIHAARSLTVLYHPKIDICNGIRLGIMMYGYNKIPQIKSKLRLWRSKMRAMINKVSPTYKIEPIKLNEAFSLYSEVIQVKRVKKGEAVGYGASYIAQSDIVIGILPIGYADGFNKKNTGRYVVVNNQKYEIIGEIAMDMTTIKIDDTVKVHDKVTLIGSHISVRDVANYLHSSAYEVVTLVSSRVPRVYIKDNEVINIREQ